MAEYSINHLNLPKDHSNITIDLAVIQLAKFYHYGQNVYADEIFEEIEQAEQGKPIHINTLL